MISSNLKGHLSPATLSCHVKLQLQLLRRCMSLWKLQDVVATISINCLLFLPARSWCNCMFVRPAHCYNAFVSSSLNKKSICQTKRVWKNNENVLYGAWLKTCYILVETANFKGPKLSFFFNHQIEITRTGFIVQLNNLHQYSLRSEKLM